MRRTLSFVLLWYITAVVTLCFCLFLLIFISYPHVVDTHIGPHYQSFKALPAITTNQFVEIQKEDGRALLVAQLFREHNSPLAQYADTFVNVADRYDLDFRLLPSIAMQESHGGRIIPSESNNPFGFGIYGGKVRRFTSWEEAIETVGKSLRNEYLNKGLITPYEIMTKYTPPSVEKGGPWAIAVSSFMEDLR